MNRRSGYKRKKRRVWKTLIGVFAMAGILLAIVLNQTVIMQWMNGLNDWRMESGTDAGSQTAKDQPVDETVKQDAESVSQVVVSAETMVPDESIEHQEEPQMKKGKPDAAAMQEEVKLLLKKERKQKFSNEEIHGVYFSAGKVSNQQKVEQIIERLDGTDINAVVIDVKDDTGRITFAMNNELAASIDAISNQIWDAGKMVDLFHDHGIYVIGRIVAFRDPILAVKKKEYAILKPDGSVFQDRAGDTWLNPYNQENWKYLLSVATDAVNLGFDEIQFDYIRFSTEAKEGTVTFGADSENRSKTEVITDFVQYAVKELHALDTSVSADVFGTIINSEIDANTVGQDYVELSRYLDYICPMIYPSHYADGCYGLEVPDLQPYELILGVLNDSVKKLLAIDEEQACAKVRPWLQDFTAKWKKTYQKYGVDQVDEQIKGVYDSGYSQWLLWNSSGSYSTMND